MTVASPGGQAEEQFPGKGAGAGAGEPRPGSLDSDESWHRLHPLSPFVRAGRQLVSLLILVFGISVLNERQAGGNLAIDLIILGAALAAGFVSWLVTRWQIADRVLRVETGLLRRQSRRIPLSQVQAIDVVQTGLARLLGLAELRMRVAGGDSARDGELACLRTAEAEQLRLHLLALGLAPAARAARPTEALPGGASAASDAATRGPASADVPGAACERLLFRVKTARLPVAVVLSRGGVTAAAVAAATAVAGQFGESGGILALCLPLVFGVAVALWRRFNGEYGTTVVASADGIRFSSGLVQTAAETIRPGRIQGIRLVEPLAWRMFGWCRLEVDIAGPKERREDRPEGQRLRALIPVGSRAEAQSMLASLLGSQPQPLLRPPARARWKAPLSYRYLAWSADGHFVVAARGRVTRQTTWVPLEKVQSIRWSQGPVQRTLGLATVHLDVAGRRVGATIAERDAAEAAAIMAALPDRARAARARSR